MELFEKKYAIAEIFLVLRRIKFNFWGVSVCIEIIG